MPTIKNRLKFNYDGIWSDTYNLIHVVLDNGMFEETLVATREIIETKVRGNNKPLFHSIENSPLEFDMVIAFENGFTDSSVDTIVRWLFVNQYKPLYFDGKEDRVYMCLPVGDPQIVHNGVNQGYFTIHMRCDSSHLYSQVITTNLETVSSTKIITINSDSHFDIFPEISILKNGIGHIVIESLDDGGSIFEIRDLTDLEDIYINCEKEIIQTDMAGLYRYDSIVGEFPRLLSGSNRFKITGNCTIQFRFKNKYKF